MTNQTIQTVYFPDLALPAPLLRALEDTDYTQATPIQAAAIPLLLEGRDLIGRSSTGTGKTAAFALPAVACVDGEIKRPQVLVLSPTRELALQITREVQKFAKYKEGVSVATLYGGDSMQDQIRQLKKANIVVGTPGRIMDHMGRKTLRLDDVKMAILDEADEMLSMGFIEDIQLILSQAPQGRQTVLFSATMPPQISKIASEFLIRPQTVDMTTGQSSQADIRQTYYYLDQHDKQAALSLLLRHSDDRRTMVFCNTKSMVDELAENLRGQGLVATGLHGDMNQAVRTQVMNSFRSGSIRVLIATDVAARGIDVDDVDTVINYDLPQSFEYYVHRIGRTGRAGKQGVSQTFVCNRKQLGVLRALMRFTGSEISKENLPTGGDMMARAVKRTARELHPEQAPAPGAAAKLLVDELLESGGADAYQVACILAEKLMGGDERFQGLSARVEAPLGSDHSPMVTVTASIGRSAHVTANHLVGTLAEVLDIPGRSIGKIEIKENCSTIGLREDCAMALIGRSTPLRIKGAEITFTMQKSTRGPAANTHRRFVDKNRQGRRRKSA